MIILFEVLIAKSDIPFRTSTGVRHDDALSTVLFKSLLIWP